MTGNGRSRTPPRIGSLPLVCAAALLLVIPASCARQTIVRTSSLAFLYPTGTEAVAASDVTVELPVRVGVAFAPTTGRDHPIDESQRQELLDRIASAFRDNELIGSIEVVPSTYLEPGGGFVNLDRLRAAFGIDLIVLLSYEQVQFTTSTGRSFAYWTVVGAYIVNGEKNETNTVLEAVVYDIRSRALLFRAAGSSASTQRMTPVGEGKGIRSAASEGFGDAAEVLISNLASALEQFETQARAGTVRGVGTPTITVQRAGAAPGAGSSGAGSWGIAEIALLCALGALGRIRARGRRTT